jgi:cold shock protein
MLKGTVEWYNDTKGFGFIACENGQRVFFERKNIAMKGDKYLSEGQHVLFDMLPGDKGPKAENVIKAV